MTETPVDPGISSAPKSLGLSLGFIEGSALVSLTDRVLAEGLVVRALDLQLAEVEFPLDLEGGADQFQRRSTTLQTLVLDAHVELIARAMTRALSKIDTALTGVELRTEGDRLVLEASLGEATFATTVLLTHDDDRTVRFHLLEPIVIGASSVDAWSVPRMLLAAARQALATVSERAAQSLRLVGASTFAIDAADALLWGLMPRHGWKVPHHDEAPMRRVSITPAGFVRAAIGEPADRRDADAGTAADEQDILRALARDDIEKSLQAAREKLFRGDGVGAFSEMRNRLDPSGGPDALVARLLALGASVERLFDETNDLADDRLAKDPSDVRALLAKGAIASAERRAEEAARYFESAGRKLKSTGDRRQAGIAFRAAALQVDRLRTKEADKWHVRLLEDTIALRPDDTVALSALVEALPDQGRAPAAVRASRRLANLAHDPETRVLAHVRAGELLRDPIGDPAQSKRELERALRIAPEDPRALEGLARAVMDEGDTRQAAAIFERLIERAEIEGRREHAARLSLALGDLWRGLDAEAAMLRYQRARELDRTSVPALARIAEIAMAHGGAEAAMEAVEAALPMLDDGRIGGDRAAALSLRMTAGRLYEEHADLVEEAIVQYDAALALAPETTGALVALSRLYERKGDRQHRAAVIDRHAKILADAGDLDAAAAAWTEEAKIHATDPTRLARIQAAIVARLAKEHSHRGLLEALVEVASLANDPTAIIDAIDRRLLLSDSPPVRAKLLTRLGAAFEEAGRIVEAARAYEEAIAADSTTQQAVDSLVRIYRSRQDLERLANVLALAAELTSEDEARAGTLTERARLLREVGRDEEAYASVTRALEALPSALPALGLATALAIKLGKHQDGRDYALRRLAASEGKTADKRLPIYVDLARIAETTNRRDELIDALQNARDLADPESETGRQLAARLARELYGAERIEELAELQRRRGRVATAPPAERAERFIEAARLSIRLGQDERSTEDIEEALSILGTKRADVELKLTALDVLEESARKRDDLPKLAELLGRRASIVIAPDDKERLWLEQADVLDRIERHAEAVSALDVASRALPTSFALAERHGRAAQRANQSDVAARAFGRAARIAEARGTAELSIEMHGRAAETYALIRDRDAAAAHDRALVEQCGPSDQSPWLAGAMERLERYGRDKDDPELLAEILGRRAAAAAPEDAAQMLLEKADVHTRRPGAEREALDALRRARHLAPRGSDTADAIDDRLVEVLEELGLHAEQAAVLVERADRMDDAAGRAGLYFRAAELYADRLRDRGMALSRAQAAVRADPNHDPARLLRIKLLREGGRRDALAEALAEEAELCRDARRAAELWLEAAQIITPLANVEAQDPREIAQSLDLVRRAATASPTSSRPFAAAALYTRALARFEDEATVLAQLVEREQDATAQTAAQIRRVDLLAGPLQDPVAAQAELSTVLVELVERDVPVLQAVTDLLPDDTKERLQIEVFQDVRASLLQLGLTLTEHNQDWAAHVRTLMWLVEVSPEPKTRADLRTRAGGVLEWKLGDGEGAEREYLAALALLPDDERPREALENFYLAVDRFGDIAENLGTEKLVAVWERLGDDEPPNRIIAAAEALWPKLARGSEARAKVQLRLADLYVQRDKESEGADAVHILEQIAQSAPRTYQDAALERLRVFFLENDRADLYCDVLRRQAERVEDDRGRALALAELGEALEWKLGDGHAAENEYRAALAADATCDEAKQRLAQLLSSQDRFEEIAEELGIETLEHVLQELLGQGSRDRERAIVAAEALGAVLPSDRVGATWLRVADAFEVDEATSEDRSVRVALQRAADHDGPNQKQALTRLAGWLARADERGELANVMRRRIELERDPDLRGALHLELGRLVMSMLNDVEGPGREAIEEEAERELRAALDTDPKNDETRALLERLYLERSRHLEIGRVLGRDVLERLRAESESDGDELRARGAVSALAELSEGTERAALLVELVGHAEDGEAQPGLPRTPEDLYRAALVADDGYAPAREGLRALLESEGRYREIAEALDVTALVDTVEMLRNAADDRGQLLPASLALAHVLEQEEAPSRARAALWTEIAELHLAEEDVEAGERALREALAIDPAAPVARESLRELLVAEQRLADLADIDDSLVATTAQRASDEGDIDLQIAALDVLAERKVAEAKADTLVLIAALERGRDRPADAERRLVAAIEAHPPHKLARSELESLLWGEGRYGDLVEHLGAMTFVARVENAIDAAPDEARAAADATAEVLEPADRAFVLELRAQLPGDDQLDDLEKARALWDELEDDEGRFRTRLAIVELRRDGDDRSALLLALEAAHAYAPTAKERARLAVERASLMTKADERSDARALVEPMVADLTLPHEERRRAARLLVDDLLSPNLEAIPSEDVELRARSLEILTELPSSAPPPEEAKKWFLELSRAREVLAYDTASVAQPLESALTVASEDDGTLPIRRRLVELYEQVGDWGQAERHASVIAEADDKPEQWVQLSELRVWLDDAAGAQSALDRALELDPSSEAAHESMIRLAEQSGEAASVITRLEAWAEVDADGDASERAHRLLRAAELAIVGGDADRAALLAERAVTLVPRGDPEVESIAAMACRTLEPEGLVDARIAILTRVVQEGPTVSAASRLALADLLAEQGRNDEARTVIEQGVHRDAPDHDPLVERLIATTASLTPDAAARRLLATAERLGAGPAARRLRMAGAELAESAGERETARAALTNIVSEVGGEASKAREALVRITRDLDDAPALVAALEEAALDASTPEARAMKWAEAAGVADRRLDDPDRAELLLTRAITEQPDDPTYRAQRIELLESRERWIDLLAAYEREAESTEGEVRASWRVRRAELAASRLRDEAIAGADYAEAYRLSGERSHAERAILAYQRLHDPAAVLALVDSAGNTDEAARRTFELAAVDALESLGRIDEARERLNRSVRDHLDDERLRERWCSFLHRHNDLEALARALDAIAAKVETGEAICFRLAAARIFVEQLDDAMAGQSILVATMSTIERHLESSPSGLDDLPSGDFGEAIDQPLLDLAQLADRLDDGALRVDALRLYAQSLSEGPEQWRALLLLASAERATGDLDAAEFTLRGVVEAVRESDTVSFADRLEAERSLGALLLDRGHVEDAVVALERAAKMLADVQPTEDAEQPQGEAIEERAQVLVLLASAYRTADRARDAVETLVAARALAPEAVPDLLLDEAIEAAGPSAELAALLERRAERMTVPRERSAMLYEAARTWETLGRADRAFEPWLAAHEADATSTKGAVRLQEALYEAERYEDLERHLARRLDNEDLTDVARATIHVARATILHHRLGRAEEALDVLERAAQIVPQSVEVLTLLANQAEALGRDDTAQDAFARLATVARTEIAKRRALVRRATILERSGRAQGALQCLEEAVRGALDRGVVPRTSLERLAAAYRRAGDHQREAQTWVRASGVAEGAEAVACLFRAGSIRHHRLDDPRGATAAYEAALRKAPDALGLRRATIRLALGTGDAAKASHHLEQGRRRAKRIGATSAANGFEARTRLVEAPAPPADPAYRQRRSELDRSGRWAELAELEAARAAELDDPMQRAERFVAVGQLFQGSKIADARRRAADAFRHALEANRDDDAALAELLRIASSEEDWATCAPLVDRLEALGGPDWPGADFELLGARVAQELGDSNRAFGRLVQAAAKDPGNVTVRRELMLHAHRVGDAQGARVLVDGYEAVLDPVLDVEALGAVHAERSLVALSRGDTATALREVERMLDLTPTDDRARRIRRRILEQSGETHFLLDALEEEAAQSDKPAARAFLVRALDIARESKDARRGRRLAAALEATLGYDAGREAETWRRLLEHHRRELDGAGMLRALDRLGDPVEGATKLPQKERSAIVRACFEARRIDEAARLLAVGSLTFFEKESDEPPRLAKTILDAVGVDTGAATVAVLERLHEAMPHDRRVTERLAEAYGKSPAAAAPHRRLLASDPSDVQRLARLHRIAPDDAGVAAALAWFEDGACRVDGWTDPTGEGDALVAGIADDLGLRIVVRDGGTGAVVLRDETVEVGASLVEDAWPNELRFLCVRAKALHDGLPAMDANRQAFSATGDLCAAIRGLRRLDPRTWSERLVTSSDRIASVRRWRRLSDLLSFAISGAYTPPPAPKFARF